MRLHVLVSLSVCLSIASCARSNSVSDPLAPGTGIAEAVTKVGDYVIGEPISYANLKIFPVSSSDRKDDNQFITLDEGLQAGTVEILELGAATQRAGRGLVEFAESAGGPAGQNQAAYAPQHAVATDPADAIDEVGSLRVINRSEKPLYLMPGEIIVGGQQDRVIAEETIIPPGDKPVRIEVFCVEPGRWSLRDAETTAALLSEAGIVASEAFSVADRLVELGTGNFVASVGSLNKSTRLTLQASQDQETVWATVNTENAKSGANMESGTFTANYTQRDVVEKFAPYKEKLEMPIAEQERIVGVIVAINGKVEMMDIFGSTPLFRKLWPKLLKSYALDAAYASEADAEAACSVEDAKSFFADAMDAKVEEEETKGELHLSKRSSERLTGFEGGMGGGFGGGGLGGGVHGGFFSK
jgi:ARG and Rhodanese-Phosphatase-superfamily-associated Protein domain